MDLISLPVMPENQWLKCSFRWEKALTDDAMPWSVIFWGGSVPGPLQQAMVPRDEPGLWAEACERVVA